MRFACRDHVVVGTRKLHHPPHGVYIVSCEPPIALCIEVSKNQLFLMASQNSPNSSCNLSRDECLSPAWRLMIKKNPVTNEQAIGLTIINGEPMARDLTHTVGCL